jgi:hypothetical protein
VVPPAGAGWHKLRDDNYSIAFVKVLPTRYPASDKGHTFYVMAWISRLEAPANSSSAVEGSLQQRMTAASKRLHLLMFNQRRQAGRKWDCVVYDAQFEERDNPRFPASTVLIMDTHGLYCAHPLISDAAVNLFYSERRVRGIASYFDEALRKEAEDFIDNVTLIPAPSGPLPPPPRERTLFG